MKGCYLLASILATILLFLLMSCRSHGDNVLENGVESLSISSLKIGGQDKSVIREKQAIKEIIAIINSSHPEPVKFRSEYEVEIIYSNLTSRSVFVNGKNLNIDGLTYQAREDLGMRLAAVIASNNR